MNGSGTTQLLLLPLKWIGARPEDLCTVLLLGLACCLQAQTNAFPEFRVAAATDYLLAVSQEAQAQAVTNAGACFLLARVQSNLGKTDVAERLARQGLELDPKRADIEYFLAEMLIREDRMEEVAQRLRRAVQLDPSLKGGYRLLGMALDRLGDHNGAQEAFNAAIHQFPGDARARLFLGRLLLDQAHFPEAIAQLDQVCQLEPESPNGFYVLSQAHARAGQHEAAHKSLGTFQQLKQKEKAQDQSAMDAGQGGRYNDFRMRTFAADFHEAMAILLLGQGQAARAEAHLRQVLRVAPALPVGYQRLAAFYIHAGRLPEARELLTTLVSLQPNEASGHVNLATLLLQLREYSAAVQELERALEISPKQSEALQNLALLYLNTRSRLPEALDLCQRLAVCQPNATSYDLLGWAFYANGRTNEALEASGKAVACEPDNAVYRERHRRLELVAGAAQPPADGKAGDSKP